MKYITVGLLFFLINFTFCVSDNTNKYVKKPMKGGSGQEAVVGVLLSINPPLMGALVLFSMPGNEEMYRNARPNDDKWQIEAHADVVDFLTKLSLFNLAFALIDKQYWWVATTTDILSFTVPSVFGLYTLEEVKPSQNIRATGDMKLLK